MVLHAVALAIHIPRAFKLVGRAGSALQKVVTKYAHDQMLPSNVLVNGLCRTMAGIIVAFEARAEGAVVASLARVPVR